MRLSLFVAADSAPYAQAAQFYSQGGAGIITSQIGGDAVAPGYRPMAETMRDESNADPSMPLAKTHSKAGPWVVSGEAEVYPGTGGEYSEILIYRCDYAPIPESDNPWVPIKQLQPAEQKAIAA